VRQEVKQKVRPGLQHWSRIPQNARQWASSWDGFNGLLGAVEARRKRAASVMLAAL